MRNDALSIALVPLNNSEELLVASTEMRSNRQVQPTPIHGTVERAR